MTSTWRAPRLLVAAIAVALSALLSGCTPQGCTAIGAYDGVEVMAVGFASDAVLTLQICRGTTCQSAELDLAQRDSQFVDLAMDSVTPKTLTVSVRSADGHTFLDRVPVTVSPKEYSPNGAKCGPTVWDADLRLTPTGIDQTGATSSSG